MPTRFGRFFLLIFIWLQCLAPLLHAHAGEPGHSGLHLPGNAGVMVPGDDAAGLYAAGQHTHTQPALCVSSAIRAAECCALFAHPPLAPAWAMPSVEIESTWSPTPHLDPPPLQVSRQLPLSGAPPSA